ncbi:MAG TPA: VWA domain-containing protein [Terriglobales bacterium]|nr:VWA domain-containing protein [Terriglobales bacterium]
MKQWVLMLFAVLLAASLAAAQTSDDNLPAAPSAAKAEQEKPKAEPPPAPAPAHAVPAPETEKPVEAAPTAETSVPEASTASPARAAAAPAPSAPRASDDVPLTTIIKRVNEVNVIFTVTDKRGRFVKDLTQKNFSVLDDRNPVKNIRYFNAQTDLPLRVGLLIDSSASVRDRFRFEQESAIEFLGQMVRYKKDLAFVVAFDSNVEVVQDFTDNTEKLARAVRSLRPGGGTAMYDALYGACRDKLLKLNEPFAVRRAIVLLSDGEDNQSRVTREEALEMCQRAEVVIYTISTNVLGRTPHDKVLERYAEQTGGRAFTPFRLEEVASALAAIQEELRSQYALGYLPDNFVADGRYRTIDIKARGRGGLKIRARKGYYAPRQP